MIDKNMLQLSFDESGKIQLPLPDRIAFIDESGGFGFDFSKEGTSKFYTICAIVIHQKNRKELEQNVEKIRKQHFGSQEMKSSNIGRNIKRRKEIIEGLLGLDFSIMLMSVDKKKIKADTPLSNYKSSFIKFFCDGLIQKLYIAYPRVRIIYDELGYPEFQKGFRKYVDKHRNLYVSGDNYEFGFAKSNDEVMLQVADIIAGTINRSHLYEEETFFKKLLSQKILSFEFFPQTYESFRLEVEKQTKGDYNKEVLDIAYRCTQVFIKNYLESTDEWLLLQKEFINYLLVQSRINATRYVYSQEILDVLSEIRGKRVQPNQLYRRIIAPLRDAGVLISSSAQGYKIPVCYKDIETYINQTSGVVSPMLSRLGKCRDIIRQQTDGTVDILDEPQLKKLKRYFE